MPFYNFTKKHTCQTDITLVKMSASVGRVSERRAKTSAPRANAIICRRNDFHTHDSSQILLQGSCKLHFIAELPKISHQCFPLSLE